MGSFMNDQVLTPAAVILLGWSLASKVESHKLLRVEFYALDTYSPVCTEVDIL
jgi:hypothetical protein